jgi:Bacterial regulatory proteins, lacI family
MSTSTIKDIAQFAGVSTATASRVINGTHRGPLQVRAAVMRAVSALGYIPNPHATQLGRANGGRKRVSHENRMHEPDAMAVRALERVTTQNGGSSDSKSQLLRLAKENAHLRRVIVELTSELRQAKERSGGNTDAIRPTQTAASSRT